MAAIIVASSKIASIMYGGGSKLVHLLDRYCCSVGGDSKERESRDRVLVSLFFSKVQHTVQLSGKPVRAQCKHWMCWNVLWRV